MAYINVSDWKSDQVIEWLKGLEYTNGLYIQAFANNQVDGSQLLNLRPYELEELGIVSVGHQEIILEAVDHLKNFHYNLEKENLQYLSMQVSTISTSLYKQLTYKPESVLGTQILSDVARALSKVKTLIGWLDRYPFQGHTQYSELRVQMLRLGLELATVAQRDRFAHNPIKQITIFAQRLSQLSDYIIQDITDPMLLQPAYLDLVTLKKRESELGFNIMPSYQFIHRVTDIKYNSPAHNSGKVEDGDEIVQINYQTVVGWQYKKVLQQLQESATDVLLTLKKRPKHTKIYGQLGLIKLPSKKRSIPYRWDSIPSPRVELFNFPDILLPSIKVAKKEVISDIEDSSGNESDALTPTEIKSSDKELRLYLPKPRAAVLQRRHTICGDNTIIFQNIGNMVSWHNRRINRENLDSPSLRDKSVSFGFGLELTQRPATLGITDNLCGNRLKTSLPSMTPKKTETIQECDERQEIPISTGVSKVVRFGSDKSLEYNQDSKYVCNVADTIIESFMPIPYADEELAVEEVAVEEAAMEKVAVESTPEFIPEKLEPPTPAPRKHLLSSSSSSNNNNNNNETLTVEAVNHVVVNRETVKRGRLDKSYSTPTYNDSDVPPAIEPRQQVVKIPPVPPRKNANIVPPAFIRLPTEPTESNDENKSKVANVIDLKSNKTVEVHVQPQIKRAPSTSSISSMTVMPAPVLSEKVKRKPPVEESHEEIELVTPVKVKTLTNKKKHSLMAKRRKITLKSLGTSTTIQGHLYRRAKDKTEVAYWAKLYFVLIETALYGFKNKEAQKADCVIYLSGFTVSLAKEVYSKQFAFKVYHPKKTFYLAAETDSALAQWIEYIRQATMKGSTNLDCEPRELYSETECSEDEFDVSTSKQLCTPSPLKPVNEKQTSAENTPQSGKHYHLNFGSLKKFARGSSNSSQHGNSGENSSPSEKFLGFFSTSKSAEKKSADIVPTAQFKTYKKVKENNGGLQLGATSMSSNTTVSDMYLQSGADNSSILSGFTIDTRKKPAEEVFHSAPSLPSPDELRKPNVYVKEKTPEKLSRQTKKSLNYLHASNPNLLDFNFHSTVDFPTNNPSNCNWEQQSGMTLLDLMEQQLDEEKKDMYNKRVEQGIEKIDERTLQKKKEKPAVPPKPADPKIEKIQQRSLPITPDYAQSFKPDDKAIMYTRTKEGQKLRDFGYELIHGDDSNANAIANAKINEKQGWNPKRADKVVPLSGSLKKKSGFNWMTSSEKEVPSTTSGLGNSSSLRKSKNKNDFKGSNEKFKLPKTFVATSFEKSFQPVNPGSTSKVLRKNSAPNSGSAILGLPYFSKLAFSSSSCKEKKILGSPKLHRAIFGKPQTPPITNFDHEIFAPITFPKHSRVHSDSSRRLDSESISDQAASPPCLPMMQQTYPDLQSSLPPVFKPETYSLNMLKKTQPKND